MCPWTASSGSSSLKDKQNFNPLIPNIKLQILLSCPHVSYESSGEKLLTNQHGGRDQGCKVESPTTGHCTFLGAG